MRFRIILFKYQYSNTEILYSRITLLHNLFNRFNLI